VIKNNPTTPAVFLLAEWSVTTSAYAKYANRPYIDTPRGKENIPVSRELRALKEHKASEDRRTALPVQRRHPETLLRGNHTGNKAVAK
jgi:hypothetical protein